MKKLIALSSLSFALLVSGCAIGPPNTNPGKLGGDYELEKSAANPAPKGTEANKVILFEVDGGELSAVDEANLRTSVIGALDKSIADAGAERVERDLASGLKEEIEMAQQRGAGSYSGAEVVDYAVRTRIKNATFGSEFQEAYVDDDGNRYPPKCTYSANVSVAVDVFAIPELEKVKSLSGDAGTSDYQDTRNSNCNSVSGHGLLRSAASGAVVDLQGQLKNFFAPIGYIMAAKEYLPDEQQIVLKTTLTNDLGARPGFDVNIKRVQTNGDRYKVAEGEIGEPVLSSGANVVVGKETVDKVKIGDEVKVDHSCSVLGCRFDKIVGDILPPY